MQNAKRSADLAAAFATFLDTRREAPRVLVAKPDAQAAELASLLRTIETMAPHEGWQSWYQRFEDALGRVQKNRIWPTAGEIEDAGRAASQQQANDQLYRSTGGDPNAEPSYLYDMVAEWWLRFRDPGPGSVPKEHHAARLVQDGHATWGELFRVGFPIPKERYREAREAREDRAPRQMEAF